MKVQKILLPIIAILGALVFFSVFIVKEVTQAIVLQFGDPKKIILEPGLNFKIPFIQNVVFLDSRILNLDTPPAEVIASDQKRLIVDAFARFQIEDPLNFLFLLEMKGLQDQDWQQLLTQELGMFWDNKNYKHYYQKTEVNRCL